MPSQAPLMGTVVFARPATEVTHDTVATAAQKAGIPEKLVKEIRPRSAFIRGMRALVKNGLLKADFRDRARDDETALVFAFVVRHGEDEILEYAPQALVKFHKEGAGLIEVLEAPPGVTKEEVTAVANKFVEKAKALWTPQDVNQLVKSYVGQYARKIPLRAGVSFLPFQAETVLATLKAFYEALGITFWALPLGHSDDNAKDIHQAIIDDMRQQVDSMVAEVKDLKAQGKLTKRIGKNRLAELQKGLWQYRQLATATQTTMEELAEAAGGQAYAIAQATHPVDTLIALASKGQCAPLMVDLAAADKEDAKARELEAVLHSYVAPVNVDVDVEYEDVDVEYEEELPILGDAHPVPEVAPEDSKALAPFRA